MKLERLGPYSLEKILGRGGMGAVYVGHNVETGERAAVKVLNPALTDDQNFRERFKLEVETLKKLLHPNIVQLFAFGEQDDHLFYVMELVEGRSLQDELLSGRRFHWREVARIGIDVAQALKHAHDRGVIHRDLKPANLLIDPHEHTKLTDFGIAKLYGGASFTVDGGVLGTADYMAPEQAEGKPVTSRCDLYSLGSVLYALLTGRPPFAGKSLPEVIQGLRFEKPAPLHRLNPDVPEELENIVNQLLEKDPQKRIPTAVALANRLKAMVHALSMETRLDLPTDEDGRGSAKPIQTSLAASMRPTMPLPVAGDGTDAAVGSEAELAPGKLPPSLSIPAVTVARSATRAEGGDAPIETAAPPEKKTVFTTVGKDELGASRAIAGDEEHPLVAWLKIGGLVSAVVLLLAAFFYYATLPPDADAMYRRIQNAAEGGGEELTNVAAEITTFLATFPDDPRSDEIRELHEEIERNRLQSRFERRTRFGSGETLSPIEREYLLAMRQSTTDPAAALARFQALVDAFSGSKELGGSAEEQRTAEQCLELARQQIEQLRDSLAESIAAEKKLLAERLAAADELAGSDPAAANRIRQGIVALYDDKEWARELIQQAREKLSGGNQPE
ncbi:MAG TPA: serine/threonine-protein kinase [Pirellulaceae bacterium]|nr:serine/threonine-protein kinase [Pirellulaceae bacterium]